MLRPTNYKWQTVKPRRGGRPRNPPKPRRKFSSTKLGKQIRLNAPLEYELIVEMSGIAYPTADFIEAISYASSNPYFRTLEFRYLLIEFRKTGYRPSHGTREAKTVTKVRAMELRKNRAKAQARKMRE